GALSQHFNLIFHFAGGIFRFGAVAAQTTRQPLGHDKPHGGCNEERLDPHVDKTGESAQRVVGVQSREYHVPGQCRLHCDLSGLQIAYLADHYLVGVLAEDRAQSSCEGVPDIRLSVDLADPLDRVFDRFLNGHDFSRAVVNFLQGGIEGGRFAGPRRAGNQDDAVRLADPVTEQPKIAWGHAEAIELELPAFLRQQAQHQRLAPRARQGRDADIDHFAAEAYGQAAILRQPPLGDVEPGNQLDARRHRVKSIPRQGQPSLQHAIETKAYPEIVLGRFYMDVRSPLIEGLPDQIVHQFDYRRLFGELPQMANFIRQVAPVGGEPLLHPIKGSVESLGSDKAPAYGCAGISGRNKFLEVHHQRIAGGNP